MFTLFGKKSVHDEDVVCWLFDCYDWALRNLDASVFFGQTRLVYPNNEFFPGEEHSEHSKSQLILDQVSSLAGMTQWPVRLVDEESYLNSSFTSAMPRVEVTGTVRGTTALQPRIDAPEKVLFILFQPELLQNPQALIANYSQTLANYLAHTVSEEPPGGREVWPLLTEVIAIFMGFGLMFANTSGNVRINSCGSCQPPVAQRVNYLSQYDAAYALAIFSVLKSIDPAEINRYLKKTLHTFFRKAVAEVMSKEQDIKRLRAYKP